MVLADLEWLPTRYKVRVSGRWWIDYCWFGFGVMRETMRAGHERVVSRAELGLGARGELQLARTLMKSFGWLSSAGLRVTGTVERRRSELERGFMGFWWLAGSALMTGCSQAEWARRKRCTRAHRRSARNHRFHKKSGKSGSSSPRFFILPVEFFDSRRRWPAVFRYDKSDLSCQCPRVTALAGNAILRVHPRNANGQ